MSEVQEQLETISEGDIVKVSVAGRHVTNIPAMEFSGEVTEWHEGEKAIGCFVDLDEESQSKLDIKSERVNIQESRGDEPVTAEVFPALKSMGGVREISVIE